MIIKFILVGIMVILNFAIKFIFEDKWTGVVMSEEVKGVKDFYNAAADDWANEWYSNETMLPLLQKFLSLFNNKPYILDAGCGAGYESMRLQIWGRSHQISTMNETAKNAGFNYVDEWLLPDEPMKVLLEQTVRT